MRTKALLKCRFCAWTVAKWMKHPEPGQGKHGMPRLIQHIEETHGANLKKMTTQAR
jgi:hypothetical protein